MIIEDMLIEKGGKMLGKLKDEGSARLVGCLTEEVDAIGNELKRKKFEESLYKDIEKKRRSLNSPYLDSQEFENFYSDCKPFARLLKHIDDPQCLDDEKIAEIVRDAKTHNSKLTLYDYSPLEYLCKFVIAKYEEFLKETDTESYNRSMKSKEAIAQEKRLQGFILESEKNICEKIDEKGHAIIPNDPIRPWIPTPVDHQELTYRYKTDKLPLIGRDDEMETLRDFCNDSTHFLWYAICGPGGMGKSRLAYEFAIEMREKRWTVYWLKPTDYKHLNDMSFEGKNNVLIVADYVLMHTKEIAECIQRLESIETKIRLLLLERANEKLSQSSEEKNNSQDISAKPMQNYPLWMSLQLESSRLKYSLFKDDPQEFLFLNVLPDEQIKEVIKKYARIIAPSKPLEDKECEKILDRLKEIDKKFKRTLYARMIVLLWSRDKNWQTYSTAELMESIFDHEMDRWKDYLKDTTTKSSQKQLLEMLAIVTMNGGMTESEMKTNHLNLYDEMKQCLREEDVVSFFDENEMLETNSKGEDILCAVEPDLFGEYLVLKWLDQGPRQKHRLNILFDDSWFDNPNKRQFFLRFITDYGNFTNNEFWEIALNREIDSKNYLEVLIKISRRRFSVDTRIRQRIINFLLDNSEQLKLHEISSEFISDYTLALMSLVLDEFQRISFFIGDKIRLESSSLKDVMEMLERACLYHEEFEIIVRKNHNKPGFVPMHDYLEMRIIMFAISFPFEVLEELYPHYELAATLYVKEQLNRLQEGYHRMKEIQKVYMINPQNRYVAQKYACELEALCDNEYILEIKRDYFAELKKVYITSIYKEDIAIIYAFGIFRLYRAENNLERRDELGRTLEMLAVEHKGNRAIYMDIEKLSAMCN